MAGERSGSGRDARLPDAVGGDGGRRRWRAGLHGRAESQPGGAKARDLSIQHNIRGPRAAAVVLFCGCLLPDQTSDRVLLTWEPAACYARVNWMGWLVYLPLSNPSSRRRCSLRLLASGLCGCWWRATSSTARRANKSAATGTAPGGQNHNDRAQNAERRTTTGVRRHSRRRRFFFFCCVATAARLLALLCSVRCTLHSRQALFRSSPGRP
ncbi:hypothetical protein BDV95DRAFT_327263 [Massariosphaeria phaeospora]|uniref:Uncharacterized protein n=1 Tax=Massariosphaeria phaeospora TaxID=100035 RepID=A0A7C8MPS1_9PLEO|nr:hypothetical protein BDV95DRAFT_327263 [Massariosphaeria phaeospora]